MLHIANSNTKAKRRISHFDVQAPHLITFNLHIVQILFLTFSYFLEIRGKKTIWR